MTTTHTAVQIPDAAVQAAYKACEENTHLPVEERLRRGIAAALPHLPLGHEVKKLEWEELISPRDDGPAEPTGDIEAISVLGEYSVCFDTDESVANSPWCCWGPNENIGHFTNIPEAKAAAQADYERRLLENLVIVKADVDVAAVRRRALEEAAQLVENKAHIFHSRENTAAAIRALSVEPAQGGQWQPIETAPKDGSVIDVFVKSDFGGYRQVCLFYDENESRFVRQGCEIITYEESELSHWMPQPPAPEGGET